MTNQQYRAIGFFFSHYERNLQHIFNFHKFLRNRYLFDSYTKENSSQSFQKFISEFRVARNVKKGSGKELLKLTCKWVGNNKGSDVHGFANAIKDNGLSHDGVVISLASKILFLNDPYTILPYDSQVKKSVSC